MTCVKVAEIQGWGVGEVMAKIWHSSTFQRLHNLGIVTLL